MSTALNGSSRSLAKQPIASSSTYLDHDPANPILASHPTLQPATKWFQDIESDGSDSDGVGLVPHNRGYKLKKWANNENFGGSKLRAPPPVQEETEIVKMGKKRTVIKRKRKRYDEWSDDEDPYSDIKVEEILSPLETPSDIVKRSSLRRILKSGQIEFLARTSMEFIESEKNFNKILSRLSNIIQFDDPQYLDIRYDRDMGPGPGLSGLNGFMRPRRSRSPSGSMANGESTDDPMEVDEIVDREAREILRRVRELVQENINCSNEFLMRFHNARDKLTKAHLQKEQLWKRLKSKAAEQHKKGLPAASAGSGSAATAAAGGTHTGGGMHAGGAGNSGPMERERERDRIGGGLISGALAYHSLSGSASGNGNGRLGNHDG